MYSMEVLSIFLLILTLTAAQHRPQNPRFRNTNFRNVRTPLVASAARDRSYISIPIVLLPDGQALPKPKHATYHYVGNANQNGPPQNNPRNNKNRGATSAKSTANSPVAIPLPSPPQQKKVSKPPKLTASQLNSHLRNSQSTFLKNRGIGNAQLNQPQKSPQQSFEQSQQTHQVQFMKQQRNPTFQQQNSQSQQTISNHKQNVANFVNFATHLGATILSQQQNQPVILPTQTPSVGFAFQNQANHKNHESHTPQKSLLSNHKLNNGVVFQHQVPNIQTVQLNYAQLLPNNLANHNNNGYVSNLQQLPQQSQINSQPNQQQDQQTHTTSSSQNQYLPASTLRTNAQNSHGTDPQNTAQYLGNQAQFFQQSSGNNVRTPTNQNNVVLLNNFNSQTQQNNQQSYAPITAQQQSTHTSQVASSYETQTLPKNSLSSQQQQDQQQQQSSGADYTLNSHNLQASHINQNQPNLQNYNLNTQGNQISFPNNAQSSSTSYASSEVPQTNSFSTQNTQTSVNQLSDPLAYFQYQTAQDLPVTYASLFNQGQTGYITSTQNNQQNEAALSAVDQSYAVLPSNQNAFSGSSFPTIFVTSQQDESSSSNSPSAVGIQAYEAYSNDQSSYLPSSNQANQATYISTQNLEKGYSFLPSVSDSQTSQSSENQLPQSSSTAENGQLVYSSSSPKQISSIQSQSSYSSTPQQYSSSNYQSSPTYVAFSTSNSDIKSNSQSAQNYGQKSTNIVTPGTTYAKLTQNSAKQSETSEASDNSEDSEYDDDEDTEEEEASYKVVYIPLDILKNILSNSVENQ